MIHTEVVDGVKLSVSSYHVWGTGMFSPVCVEVVKQRDGTGLWAVRQMGHCLTKSGQWVYEPLPSIRTDAFIKRTRFDSVETAIVAWKKANQKGRVDIPDPFTKEQ